MNNYAYPTNQCHFNPIFEPLESRILLSGTPTPEASVDEAIHAVIEDQNTIEVQEVVTEIVFVDSGLETYDSLLKNFDKNVEVIIIPGDKDGISFISSILSSRENLTGVHILSHGSSGQIALGSAVLSQDNLFDYKDSLQSWSKGLTADADILIYGCNFGQSGEMLKQMAALTGADIAASDDLTGDAGLGGDVELEVHVGAIETSAAFTQHQFNEAQLVLAKPVAGADVNNSLVQDVGGVTVAELFESQFSDPEETPGDEFIGIGIYYDYDGPDDNIADLNEDKGQWEFSIDNGATWHRLADIADDSDVNSSSLLLLDEDARLRFVAEDGFSGTPIGLRVHVLDDGRFFNRRFSSINGDGTLRPRTASPSGLFTGDVSGNYLKLSTLVASDDSQTIDEDNPLPESVPQPPDGDDTISEYVLVNDIGADEGSLTFNADGSYIFDPRGAFDDLGNGETRDVRFEYLARSADGSESRVQTVVITVTGINDNPVAVDDNDNVIQGRTASEIFPETGLLSNDSDVEGDVLSIVSFTNESGDSALEGSRLAGNYGRLTIQGDGTYSYESTYEGIIPPGGSVSETFTYTLSDGNGGISIGQVTFITRTTNNNPVANDDRVSINDHTTPYSPPIGVTLIRGFTNRSGTLEGEDIDMDGDSLQVTAIQNSQGVARAVGFGITPTLRGDYGTLTVGYLGDYTYRSDGPVAENVDDIFTYTISDGNGGTATAQLIVTLRAPNTTPVASDDSNVVLVNGTLDVAAADGVVQGAGTDVDAEEDTLLVTGIRTGAEAGSGAVGTVGVALSGNYGTLTMQLDGSYTYTANADIPGTSVIDIFTYTIDDGFGGTDTAQLAITVDTPNMAPVATDDIAFALTGELLEIAVADGVIQGTGTDIDAERDTLTVTNIRTGAEVGSGTSGTVGTALSGAHGTLTIQSDGSYTYLANDDIIGAVAVDIFSYEISDGNGGTDTAQLVIIINTPNAAPVATDDSGSVLTGESLNVVAADGVILGPGADTDAEGNSLIVTRIRTGAEAGTGISGTVGVALTGNYGTLTIQADGSYTYVANADIPGTIAFDTFTYTISDGFGGTDTAQLVITVGTPPEAPPLVADSIVITGSNESVNTLLGYENRLSQLTLNTYEVSSVIMYSSIDALTLEQAAIANSSSDTIQLILSERVSALLGYENRRSGLTINSSEVSSVSMYSSIDALIPEQEALANSSSDIIQLVLNNTTQLPQEDIKPVEQLLDGENGSESQRDEVENEEEELTFESSDKSLMEPNFSAEMNVQALAQKDPYVSSERVSALLGYENRLSELTPTEKIAPSAGSSLSLYSSSAFLLEGGIFTDSSFDSTQGLFNDAIQLPQENLKPVEELLDEESDSEDQDDETENEEEELSFESSDESLMELNFSAEMNIQVLAQKDLDSRVGLEETLLSEFDCLKLS